MGEGARATAPVAIRDVRPSWACLAGLAVGWPVWFFLNDRLDESLGISWNPESSAPAWQVGGVLGVLAVVAALAWTHWSPSVRIGSTGLEFRTWLRKGHFAWSEIETFEVGREADPRFAYVILRSSGASPRRAVGLPEFWTHDGREVVETLLEAEHQFRS